MYNTLKRVLLDSNITSGKILITNKNKLHHLLKVLHVRKGTKLRIFNASDGEWLAEVVNICNKEIECIVISKLKQPEISLNIQIAFAPIKQDRMKFLIEKTTEIGVSDFLPVITNRSIVRNINTQKLDAYILSAVEQSERLSIPKIKETYTLKQFLDKHYNYNILFCNEHEHSIEICDTLIKKNIVILIGPEGGFTDEERDLLNSRPNVTSIRLTKNTLRAETAAIVALSSVIMRKN